MEVKDESKIEEKGELATEANTARQLVVTQLEEVNRIALEYETTSQKMVARSIRYDAFEKGDRFIFRSNLPRK